jgi:phage portal protein BeeE
VSLLDKVSARHGGRKDFHQPPFWAYDGLTYPYLASTSLAGDRERIESSFEGYVQGAYKADGIVFACIAARTRVFSQARFQWREFRAGRPGDLFGTTDLALLEDPWPNGTTGELLARMEAVASLAGNYYATTADDQGRLGRAATGNRRIVHLRPDWTDIVIDAPSGNPNGLDARVVGYSYWPPASAGLNRPEPVILLPSEVCHFSPIPDPLARFRGMSWLTPIVEEIRADKAATLHKSRFFSNGATPNMAVVFNENTGREAFEAFVDKFNDTHQGADNAYKTLFLAGGADIRPLSVDLRQLDFKATQGAGETRIAAAAGVHPVIVGLSEGLQGSSLNAGNYNAAKRNFAETTLQHLWSVAAASLASLVTAPSDRARLWFDARDIPFLREDAADLAEIRGRDAQTIRTLVDGGFEPDAAVAFVTTNDPSRLSGRHSGLLPVQLQPPGSGEDLNAPSQNGRPSGLENALAR